MSRQEFFEGEQVAIHPRLGDGKSLSVTEPIFIGVVGGYFPDKEHGGEYLINDDKGKIVYGLWEHGILIDFHYVDEHGCGESVEGKYSLQRLNPGELESDFTDLLKQELSLVERVMQEKDIYRRAAVLSTLRNLNSYLNRTNLPEAQNSE